MDCLVDLAVVDIQVATREEQALQIKVMLEAARMMQQASEAVVVVARGLLVRLARVPQLVMVVLVFPQVLLDQALKEVAVVVVVAAAVPLVVEERVAL